MIRLPIVPDGYADLVAQFGDPTRKGFVRDHLQRCELPYPMRASWDEELTVRQAYVHIAVADAMIDALLDVMAYRGYEWLVENNLDRWGGVHAKRYKTGSSTELSVHAWAAALDLNPHRGPFGKPTDMPAFIVDAFEKRGFVWGGRWKVPDGMHFQAVKNY